LKVVIMTLSHLFKPEENANLRIISLGAGVQSTVMALMSGFLGSEPMALAGKRF
jgi:hypothetical protein